MKRYTDKQLRVMTPEELEAVQQQAFEECQKAGQQLEELLAKNPFEKPTYYFPFGQKLHPLVQEDTSPKKVFGIWLTRSGRRAFLLTNEKGTTPINPIAVMPLSR